MCKHVISTCNCSQQFLSWVASYLFPYFSLQSLLFSKFLDCLLFIVPTLQAALATICVCSCKHNSSWMVTSIYAQMKHSLANLRDLIPTLVGFCFMSNVCEVGIKSCRFARECVLVLICACMDVTTQLELCLYKQTQIVANAVCRLGSK